MFVAHTVLLLLSNTLASLTAVRGQVAGNSLDSGKRSCRNVQND